MSFEPILTSFFAREALAQRIEAAYGFPDVRCQLITATLRDVYLVESRAGRHILIVYRHDQRTWDEIAAEWQLVDYLAQHAVPVAPAIATIHTLADRAPIAFGQRAQDIATRLDQALAGMRTVLGDSLTERAYLEECGQELQAPLQALPET